MSELQRKQDRFVAASRGDFRKPGVKRAYHEAHTAYYRALGRALDLSFDRPTGYYQFVPGGIAGLRRMEERAVEAGLLEKAVAGGAP